MQKSLALTFFEQALLSGDKVAVRYKGSQTGYCDLSWSKLSRLVRELAFGLASLGLNKGNCVALFSQTSYQWVAADFATIANGAVSVPIYPTSSQSDIEFILMDSEASFIFVQNESLLQKVLAIRDKLSSLKQIIMLEALKNSKSLFQYCQENNLPEGLLLTLSHLRETGKKLSDEQPSLIDERINLDLDSPATIIYTSGTTGTPKGVELTHSNIAAILQDMRQAIPISNQDVYLSYLPLSHVFERICGEFYWMYSGSICAFAESIETMAKNIGEVQPTMILVVPRVLDRIYQKVQSGIEGASPRARKLIEWAIAIGREMVRHHAENIRPRLGLVIKHFIAEKLVFRKLRERIDRRLRIIVSGGAPATPEVIEFFNAIGITTLEGYGLTETAAPATANRACRVKIGTVGTALPSVEIKIAPDGEILLRGPTVFKRYYKNEAATAEAFENGWFKTGDIGAMDNEGYLKITDRKKDLIVNSSGKNIAPQRIEARLRTVPLVNQAVVFGDRKKSLVALLTLDKQQIIELAREKNWKFDDYEDLIRLSQLKQHLRKEIAAGSNFTADYEQIRQFTILPEDLCVEAGELTATLKVKRNVIAKKYERLIENMYKHQEETDQKALAGALR